MENKLLVQGRECGACTACCVEMAIEDGKVFTSSRNEK